MAKSLFSLLAIAVGAGLLVSWADRISRDRIEANRQATLRETLSQVLDPDSFDNDLLATRRALTDTTLLSGGEAVDAYFAMLRGQPTAVVLTPSAGDGYNGPIDLLVGVHFDGRLTGVRILAHKETPGLGDGIEQTKSNWVLQFDGRTLENPSADRWLIRADGGEFDQLTGATVTPRAVVKAVKNTLTFVNENRPDLMTMAGEPPTTPTSP